MAKKQMKRPASRKCSACHGTGIDHVVEERDSWGNITRKEWPCPKCSGTGFRKARG